MQVHLPSRSAPSPDLRAMCNLVAAIGRPGFAGTLFAFAHDLMAAAHVTAFCTAPGAGIRTVLAENDGVQPVARAVAERYVRHHWTGDPVEKALAGRTALRHDERRCVVVGSDAADVEPATYRDECYLSVNLNQRLSIADVRGGSTMRVNFYRRRGRDFSQGEIERFMEIADLVAAMVWRHDEDTGIRDAASREALFLRRLGQLRPALTPRERQVCALVALGLTSEAIALRLRIGVNTVMTYRKRAYARLSISSQNELMHRLMG